VFAATPQNVKKPIYGAITGNNHVLVHPLARVRSHYHVFDAADSIARHKCVFTLQMPHQDLDSSPQVGCQRSYAKETKEGAHLAD
jgi:hypothetical protein